MNNESQDEFCNCLHTRRTHASSGTGHCMFYDGMPCSCSEFRAWKSKMVCGDGHPIDAAHVEAFKDASRVKRCLLCDQKVSLNSEGLHEWVGSSGGKYVQGCTGADPATSTVIASEKPRKETHVQATIRLLAEKRVSSQAPAPQKGIYEVLRWFVDQSNHEGFCSLCPPVNPGYSCKCDWPAMKATAEVILADAQHSKAIIEYCGGNTCRDSIQHLLNKLRAAQPSGDSTQPDKSGT